MSGFANFDAELFLRDYWQRKPLLIKQALPGLEDPLAPEELAGLALEDCIDSRIVELAPEGWRFQQGPFAADDFNRDNPWTLLVQSVDHLLDEVASLRRVIQFLPSWRFDDVMISYAEAGGGVGPHYDNYDVFLLQGQGSRTWRLGQYCDENSPLIEHTDLRILAEFNQSEEYVLHSGDVLYVPPRLAHWGVSNDESLTYSLGFRATPVNHMLSRATDELLNILHAEALYIDPPLAPAARAGEINTQALAAATAQVEAALARLKHNSNWFGELVTESEFEPGSITLRVGDTVRLDPAARVAWHDTDSSVAVFANGRTLQLSPELLAGIIALCEGRFITIDKDLPLEFCLQLRSCGCLSHD